MVEVQGEEELEYNLFWKIQRCVFYYTYRGLLPKEITHHQNFCLSERKAIDETRIKTC